MQCKCGFENAADARFCGNCRSALGDVPGSAVPNAAASSTAPPVAAAAGRAPARPISRAHMAIVAAVVVVASGRILVDEPACRDDTSQTTAVYTGSMSTANRLHGPLRKDGHHAAIRPGRRVFGRTGNV